MRVTNLDFIVMTYGSRLKEKHGAPDVGIFEMSRSLRIIEVDGIACRLNVELVGGR